MTNALFVTGTDTDIGKTIASKAILQAFAAKNLTTIGYKPVAAGCENTESGFRNSDALHLMNVSTYENSYSSVNPYALALPTSPHIAAKYEQITIDFSVLSDTLNQHKKNAEIVVIEGVGGWRVPISEHDYLSSWVKQENIPVVLVVGVQLGCLSHAILTAESIRADGLEIVGWVANRINPGTEHYADLIETLAHAINAPKLGEIPYVPGAKRKDLSRYIDIEPLL